jgi:hypothetical protein
MVTDAISIYRAVAGNTSNGAHGPGRIALLIRHAGDLTNNSAILFYYLILFGTEELETRLPK